MQHLAYSQCLPVVNTALTRLMLMPAHSEDSLCKFHQSSLEIISAIELTIFKNGSLGGKQSGRSEGDCEAASAPGLV